MVLKIKISYAISRIYLHRRSIQAIKNIKYYKNHKAVIKQWIFINKLHNNLSIKTYDKTDIPKFFPILNYFRECLRSWLI